MNQEGPDNPPPAAAPGTVPGAPAADQQGQAAPGKPCPGLVAIMIVVSAVVAIGLLGMVAWLTADRIRPPLDSRGQGDRLHQPSYPPGQGPSASASGLPGGTGVRGNLPAQRRVADRSDLKADPISNVLGYLAGGAPSSDVNAEEQPELAERLRIARQMTPLNVEANAEVPDDLKLPDGAKVLFSVPTGVNGSGDLVIIARVPGTQQAVRDFLVAEGTRGGWAHAELAAANPGMISVSLTKGKARRVFTIRQLATGQECLVATYDSGS